MLLWKVVLYDEKLTMYRMNIEIKEKPGARTVAVTVTVSNKVSVVLFIKLIKLCFLHPEAGTMGRSFSFGKQKNFCRDTVVCS